MRRLNKKASNAINRMSEGQYAVIETRNDVVKVVRTFSGIIDACYFIRNGNSHLTYGQKIGHEIVEIEASKITGGRGAYGYSGWDDWDDYWDDYWDEPSHGEDPCGEDPDLYFNWCGPTEPEKNKNTVSLSELNKDL